MRTRGRPSVDRRLRQVVELRRSAAGLDPSTRDRIWRIARELRLELGDSVPKLPAARALGISVKALDKWVAKGAIPPLRRPGAKRSQVETDAVLDLLEEVIDLRQAGVASGVIAAGIARLRDQGRLRPKLRPNRSATELRRSYRATSPVERLRTAAELSYVQTRLATLGASR
jgi:DNA-binding transcriptional MerR regulator